MKLLENERLLVNLGAEDLIQEYGGLNEQEVNALIDSKELASKLELNTQVSILNSNIASKLSDSIHDGRLYARQDGSWLEVVFPEVDLSNYYTKSETDTRINSAISNIPPPDLSSYYNKTEVDDKVTLLNNNIASNTASINNNTTLISNKVSLNPVDNKLYGRLNSNWTEIIFPEVDLTPYYNKLEVDDKLNTINTNIANNTTNINNNTLVLNTKVDKNPEDNILYGRLNGFWSQIIIPETDLTNYYNKTEIDSKVTTINTNISNNTASINNKVDLNPQDSKLYGRNNSTWVEIVYPTTDLTNYYTKDDTYNRTEIDTKIDEVNQSETYIVDDIPARDALTNLKIADQIFVIDATGDSTVSSGAAKYLVKDINPITFIKIAEEESLDVNLDNYYNKSETNTLLDTKVNLNPNDNKLYGRRNTSWAEIVIPETDLTNYYNKQEVYNRNETDIIISSLSDSIVTNTNNISTKVSLNPSDSKLYGRLNNNWTEIVFPETDLTNYYTKSDVYNKTEINNTVSILNADIVTNANNINTKVGLNPEDSKLYGRLNNTWQEIVFPETDLSGYYNKTEIDDKVTLLNENISSNTSNININTTNINNKVSLNPTDSKLYGRRNTSWEEIVIPNVSANYYNKQEIDTKVSLLTDSISNNTDIINDHTLLLNTKVDNNLADGKLYARRNMNWEAITIPVLDLSNYYTKNEVYNKTSVDNLLSVKVNANNTSDGKLYARRNLNWEEIVIPEPISVLPIANGGTGVTTVDALKTLLKVPELLTANRILYISPTGTNEADGLTPTTRCSLAKLTSILATTNPGAYTVTIDVSGKFTGNVNIQARKYTMENLHIRGTSVETDGFEGQFQINTISWRCLGNLSFGRIQTNANTYMYMTNTTIRLTGMSSPAYGMTLQRSYISNCTIEYSGVFTYLLSYFSSGGMNELDVITFVNLGDGIINNGSVYLDKGAAFDYYGTTFPKTPAIVNGPGSRSLINAWPSMTLPIANGGTGVTTLEDLRISLNIRKKITANVSYYVAKDGNDSNEGSGGRPFLTMDRMRDELKRIDGCGYNVNCYLRTGTWPTVDLRGTGALGISQFTLMGDGKDLTIIDGGGEAINVRGIMTNGNSGIAVIVLRNLQITNSYTYVSVINDKVNLFDLKFTGYTTYVGNINRLVESSDGAFVTLVGTTTFDRCPNLVRAFLISNNSYLLSNSRTIEFLSPINVGNGFIEAQDSSSVVFKGNIFTGIENVTGQRYRLTNGSKLLTNNAGLTHLPGTIVGTADVSCTYF